ncbi:MAG TPA: pyridoxal phosphate-dependent aminotransferase [Terriglobales bacterium]|jgi:aspartate/methionine/tyrosine aminotransferase|nr:pyridoxal phosphate-dependent aminotransferase [Terriglobales bacterium]
MFSHRTDWKLTPNRFTEAQQELRAAGMEVLDLTVSNPTCVGLAYDEEAIMQALVRPEALDYDPQPKGLPGAREALATYYREQHEEFDMDPESLILTTSTSEGYSYVFRLLCNPEEEILVPKPSYPLFEFLAGLADVKLVPYPLIYDHAWQIDFSSLYKAVTHRTRAVVVVHPNNPTGSYVSAVEQTELNAFCREYNLALIVDEVFLDYAHDGVARPTFARNQEALTFTLSGLSKISALPQMKLAWVAASGPEDKVQTALARLEVIADTYLSVNAPIQWAAPALLEQRKHIQPLLLDRLRTNLEELDRELAKQKACTRLDVEGGWYAVLRVPVTQSDEDLAIDLLRKVAVLVHPGHFYDFSSDGYLVVSLITPPEEFREGVRRVLQVVSG